MYSSIPQTTIVEKYVNNIFDHEHFIISHCHITKRLPDIDKIPILDTMEV